MESPLAPGSLKAIAQESLIEAAEKLGYDRDTDIADCLELGSEAEYLDLLCECMSSFEFIVFSVS